MDLEVSVIRKENDVVVLTLLGSINGTTCPILDEKIDSVLAGPIRTLVLDMSGIKFMSSMGVGIINKTKKNLTQMNAELAMINLQPQIKKVFEIMSLMPTLNIFESVEELDRYLNKIQKRISEEGTSLSTES